MELRSSIPEEARNYMRNRLELLESPKHIYYEAEKLYEAYNYFATNLNYPQFLIEGFLLHSRNLFDFFYPAQNIHPDDMCVFDFLDNPDEFNNNKTAQEDLGFDKVNVNKYLSRLSYTRCSNNQMNWPIPHIWEGMIKTIKTFYDALPDDYKDWVYFKKLNDLLNQILK